MSIIVVSDWIEGEGWTTEDVLDKIEESIGNSCDYIYFLKNLTTNKVCIDDEPKDDEED